jgi:hypothetical protein
MRPRIAHIFIIEMDQTVAPFIIRHVPAHRGTSRLIERGTNKCAATVPSFHQTAGRLLIFSPQWASKYPQRNILRGSVSQPDQWLLDLRPGTEPAPQNTEIYRRNADKFATGSTVLPSPQDTRLNVDFSLRPRQQQPEGQDLSDGDLLLNTEPDSAIADIRNHQRNTPIVVVRCTDREHEGIPRMQTMVQQHSRVSNFQ